MLFPNQTFYRSALSGFIFFRSNNTQFALTLQPTTTTDSTVGSEYIYKTHTLRTGSAVGDTYILILSSLLQLRRAHGGRRKRNELKTARVSGSSGARSCRDIKTADEVNFPKTVCTSCKRFFFT